MFVEAIFSQSRKLFSEFLYKTFVIALHDIIGLQNFSFFSANDNTEFALVLHLNCTALSQSESSNFSMCIITFKGVIVLVITNQNRDQSLKFTPLGLITITNITLSPTNH